MEQSNSQTTNQVMKNLNIKNNLCNCLHKLFMFSLMAFLSLEFQAQAQTTVTSLSNLMRYLDDDNVNVKLAPGTYNISVADVDNGTYGQLLSGEIIGNQYSLFLFQGNNSTYDFTDVTINIDTEVLSAFGNVNFHELQIIGSNNVLRNLTMVDSGDADNFPGRSATNIVMDGANNRVEGFHVTVKGSYPYGYGDIFGKSGTNVISHKKHSACLIRGNSNQVVNSTFIHRAYGHGIFFQGANDPYVEGCYVQGELSTVAAVLAEEGTGSPADDVDFLTIWGYSLYELDENYRFSLQEDGIRSYNAGETIIDGVEYDRGVTNATVIDCTVEKMRSGVTIGWASGTKYVENCTTLACESGYWVGSNTTIISSKGDASVGPLLSEDVRRSNSLIELTLLDNQVSKIGNTPSVYFAGSNHDVTINDGTTSFDSDIEFLIGGQRLGHRWLEGSGEEPPNFAAEDISFNNQTNYPIVLGENSEDNEVISCGTVTNNGLNNSITNSTDCSETENPEGDGNLVHITKRNATGYAIDGSTGGANGQSVTLSSSNITDEGQLWVEIDRGNGYYSYEKYGTNYSLDGNGEGVNNQSVYLWETNDSNQNQQWQKVAMDDGGYKLIKRNATGFAINGGSGGVEGRGITLWNSGSNSQNLQWYITPIAIHLEVEDYNNMSGIQTENTQDTGGGDNVGWINDGDWLRFDDVNLSGMSNMDARVATKNTGGTIEVRTGSATGTLIGSIDVNNTGDFQNWTTQNTTISNVSGTQDVYLVFTGGNGYLFNVNWIEFNTSSVSNKEVTTETKQLDLSNIAMYPNPIISSVTIENASNSTIIIYDVKGSEVFTKVISSERELLDLTKLTKGIYFAKINNINRQSVIEIIKN